MAFGGFSSERSSQPMAEINMVPLIDVMLVLLIIFIITIPVMNHSVKIDLPQASSQPNETKPENISLAIDAEGRMHWNADVIDMPQLQSRIAAAALLEPQPELHLRVERTTQYEKVAQVMAAAQTGGLGKIGFITDPQGK